MCVEVWNIHQFYEYCTNYPLHQEEIYIYIMWNIHQFHEYCTKYLTHQEEKIYIMSDEVENIHQFYEYCTNYPLQEEIKKYYVCWSLKYSPILWILHQLSSPPGRNIYIYIYNVKYSPIPWILHQLSHPPGRKNIYYEWWSLKYSPIPWILQQLSSPPRRKNIYPNGGEVGNIHQFHEYCTNYLLRLEEIYIYIMWNIHQFHEYCTNYLTHQEEIKKYYVCWSLKYSPILWILHQLSSPPRRKYIYPNSGEVGNINQFHEYCTNYLPHQEERIYIQMVVKLAIFTNSMNIAPIIFSTRKIYIYIMSGEVWNIHQFYEYCTNYPPHQPTIFLTRKEYMYILWVVKYKIFTNSMNIASIIFPTRKK